MIGPCMCGDTHCHSCGPAQGNSRCLVCGAWADDGCEDHAKCEAGLPAAIERERLATMSVYSDRSDGFEEGQTAGEQAERPDYITDDHLTFLDELRESGATNMFGARPYIMDEFPDLSNKQAAAVLGYWMKTFSARHKNS